MTRLLTLAAYRDLLTDVAGRHGGTADGGFLTWRAPHGDVLADVELVPPDGDDGWLFRPRVRCGRYVNLADDPAAALRNLDAVRATLLCAIAASDELAGVVVDVSRNAHPDPQEPR